eukprot:10228736-Alexandrium_andersonii.AAC.1
MQEAAWPHRDFKHAWQEYAWLRNNTCDMCGTATHLQAVASATPWIAKHWWRSRPPPPAAPSEPSRSKHAPTAARR